MLKEVKSKWILVLLIIIIGLLIINLFLTKELLHSRTSKKCLTIPRQYVIDEPDCVNKLLMSMNMTTIHVIQSEVQNYIK